MAKGKNVSKAGSKVRLNPEPSSVTFKPKADTFTKYFPDIAQADADKANKMIRKKRAAEASATTSKSALKAANKPAKLNKTQKITANEARRLAEQRAKDAAEKYKSGKGSKLTPAQKLAYQKAVEKEFNKIRSEMKKSPKTMGRGGAGIMGAFGIKNK